MKYLILFLAFLLLIFNCGLINNQTKHKVTIRGTISNTASLKTSKTKSVNSFTLFDTKKILVFNSTGSYSVFDIQNNSFEAYAKSNTAVAISFLSAENKFIGCLHAQGLNVLPLVSLKDGDNTIIDLGKLILDSTNVLSESNPFGKEIGLNDSEISWYKEVGAYFECLSNNVDADNDGIVDIIDNKYLLVNTIFSFSAGYFGINDTTPPLVIDTSDFIIQYQLRICGGKAIAPKDTHIIFAGPEQEPYSTIYRSGLSYEKDCFLTCFLNYDSQIGLWLPFKKGKYTLTIDGKNYTINYYNVCPKKFLIIPKPTVHTGANNKIISISIDYRSCDNNPIVADNFVNQVQLQLKAENQRMLCELGTLYEPSDAIEYFEKYNFTLTKSVSLEELVFIGVNYQDLLGNEYRVGWTKK